MTLCSHLKILKPSKKKWAEHWVETNRITMSCARVSWAKMGSVSRIFWWAAETRASRGNQHKHQATKPPTIWRNLKVIGACCLFCAVFACGSHVCVGLIVVSHQDCLLCEKLKFSCYFISFFFSLWFLVAFLSCSISGYSAWKLAPSLFTSFSHYICYDRFDFYGAAVAWWPE